MSHHYNLPVSVSAFSVASKVPDQQSSYERCFNNVCAALGCDICAAAGSLDNALIACYGQLVIDSEIASMTKRINRKIEVNEDSLAVDIVAEVI
jgi:trimethylamine---corrinoid protein Co-methyltransferase